MAEKDGHPEKIVLPSSGLAEDILGNVAGAGAKINDWQEAVSMMEDDAYEEKKAEEESLHLVGFFLQGEEYALDISQVQEIIRVGGWTRVPNAPGHIKGVINLRGRIIPVIDPKVKMGFAASEPTKDSRIMVIELGRKVIGMLVDSVSQVLRLPLRTIEDPPPEVTESDKGFIKGVGKMDGRLIILLDLARLAGREAEAGVSA
jgi:purine-binding chemotaxis protein CheW